MSISNVCFVFLAHNIEDCARESMKFEIRKCDLERALDGMRTNLEALEIANIKIAQLIMNESGFSSTQEPFSSVQLQSIDRTSRYVEYDQLNEEADLLEHLNIDQHGNRQEQGSCPSEKVNSDSHEIANLLKFLAERFSRILLWFDTKDPRQKYTLTPKELIEQFHQVKFIDQSTITIHKPATYIKFVFLVTSTDELSLDFRKVQPSTKRIVFQDADRVRKALAKSCLNGPDYIQFPDETLKFFEEFYL